MLIESQPEPCLKASYIQETADELGKFWPNCGFESMIFCILNIQLFIVNIKVTWLDQIDMEMKQYIDC